MGELRVPAPNQELGRTAGKVTGESGGTMGKYKVIHKQKGLESGFKSRKVFPKTMDAF